MARRCTICHSPHRQGIEEALLTKEIHTSIAERFGVSRPALERHEKNHLPLRLKEPVKPLDTKGELLDEIRALRQKAYDLLALAEGKSGVDQVIRCTAEARKQLELAAKLELQLDQGPETVVQILNVIVTKDGDTDEGSTIDAEPIEILPERK